MAVGRRAGLPVELINMPMHIISCLQPGMLPQMMPEGAEAEAKRSLSCCTWTCMAGARSWTEIN